MTTLPQITVIDGIAATQASHEMAMDIAQTASSLERGRQVSVSSISLLWAHAFRLEYAFAEGLVSQDTGSPQYRYIYMRSVANLALKVGTKEVANKALKVLLQEHLELLPGPQAQALKDLMLELKRASEK